MSTNIEPIARDDQVTTDEDTSITGDVLENDSDPDGDRISVVALYGDFNAFDDVPTSGGGLVTINAKGIFEYDPNGAFEYLQQGESATDSFTYTITDDMVARPTETAIVTVSITGVNDAPVAVDDTGTTNEDESVSIDVLANDSDVEDDDLTVTQASAQNGTVVIEADGTLTYTPDADFNGTDTFSYTVSDGNGGTDTATVTVTVNAFKANIQLDGDEDDFLSANVVNWANLPSSATLTVNQDVSNGRLNLSPNGVFRYDPNRDYNGTDTFTYTATKTDGTITTGTVTINVLPRNDEPEPEDDEAITDEDTSVTGNVLDNDTDVDGDSLDVIALNGDTNAKRDVLTRKGGLVTIEGDGDFEYDPNGAFEYLQLGQSTTDEFEYTVSDQADDEEQETATVEVEITGVNDAPVAVDDTSTTEEETSVSIDVLANDSDVEDDDLTVTQASATNGSVVIEADGTLTYTPDADFNGTDTISYTISDGNGGTDTATVTVTVNDAPEAVDDTATTNEDTSVTIDVLANDSDPENDGLSVDQASAQNGTVKIEADGTLTYTPDADFNGTDTISYTVSDINGGTDTATVTVTVNAVNDAPEAVDDTGTTNEDESASIDVLANDSDVEDDDLTVTQASAQNGAVVIEADGALTYTPDADFNGTDTISYTVSDGNGGTDTATVTVTVNAFNANINLDVVEDDSLSDNVLDEANLPSSATVTLSQDVSNGRLNLSANGDFRYNPDADFNGIDTFTYTATKTDGTITTGTVTIDVLPENDAPESNNDAATTDEGTSVKGNVLENDTDVDGPATLLVIALNGDDSNFGPVQTNNGGLVTIKLLGDFEYDPNGAFEYLQQGEFATDRFSYTISDDELIDDATVTVRINGVNDAPVAVDDTSTTEEEEFVTIDVLANDSDVDANDILTVTEASATNGSVVIRTDGKLTYTPDRDFNGTGTISYTISDGNGGTDTATVTINVSPRNDQPEAGDDDATTNEDTPTTGKVLGNDFDVDGDRISVVGLNGVLGDDNVETNNGGLVTIDAGGNFEYDPNGAFEYLQQGESATDRFTYTITDEEDFDAATVTVTINGVNDAPVAVDDTGATSEDTSVSIDVLANDSDVEDDDLTVTQASATNGSVVIEADGTLTYTPDADFNGTDTINYTVSDGNGGTDTATVTVTVNAVNDAPVAVDDTGTTNEDTSVTIDVLANDSDTEDDDLAVTQASAQNGTVVIETDGTLTYTPDADFNGTDTVSYTVSDGNSGTDTATVTVTVNPVNDAPVAVDDAFTTDEDTPISGDVLADNGNGADNDPDGDNLTVSLLQNVSNGSLILNSDGTFSFTPGTDFNGSDTFTYQVSDGNLTDTATVTVTVDAVNDAPVAVDDTGTTNEDTSVTIDVLANDSDTEDDDLAVTQASAQNGTVVIETDGTLTYTPDADFNGTDTVSYTVSDGNNGTDTATVTVTVNPVDDAPVAVDDAITTDEDTPISGDVLADNGNGADSDPDGDNLAVNLLQNVSNGSLILNGDGTFSYTPGTDFNGSDTFTYQVSDGNLTDTATVTITVDAVNDPPVAQDDALTTDEDTPVTGSVLIDNSSGADSDIDSSDLTVSLLQDVSEGTLTLNPNGSFIYAPGTNFNGSDTFTYQLSDGDLTDTATVTVTVTPVNDAPVAADDAFSTDEDTPVSGNVLSDNGSGADSDIDVDALTVSLLQDVSGGTLTLGTDGAFTYIPGVNVSGVDMFAYQVSDGDLIDTATVTIAVDPVNDPPVAQDDALATDEDTAISGDLTADNGNGPDSDVDGDTPLVYLVNGQLGGVDGTTSLPSGALLTVFADGRYFYDPNGAFDHLALGETAIDSFTYAIFDGNGGVDSATATVTIDGVNDAPDAVDDDFSTAKDSGVFGNVLADNGNGADSDPDGGTSLIVTHVNGSAAAVGSQILLPSGALLMLNADGSFLYGTNGAFEALGDDESFADSFTYTIGDGDGGSDGATATVTIDGGNEAPVAADDALATDEDTAITGNVFSDNGNGPDSDANGDTLTVSAVNGAAAAVGNEIMLPSGARLTLNSNGSFVYDPMGAFDDLSPGEADTDGFAYTVSDGKGGSDMATVSVGIDGLTDVIRGTPDEDNLSGTDGDDLIYALASDDIIDPRGGSHTIDGGSGADTVVYATTRSVFDVDLIEASGFTVAGESAALVGGHIVVERPDGETDTLIDVERIDFTDGDLIYDIDSPNVEVVYRMYAAALGRTPDETGLRYWVDRLDFLDDLPGSTADSLLQVLADVFIEADEFEMLYGSDPSNADYIDAMYQNVLGRLPDDEGRAFWIDAMERGLERDDILIAFSESAENRDQTAPDLDDGIWVI